jgi:hypothetical protein
MAKTGAGGGERYFKTLARISHHLHVSEQPGADEKEGTEWREMKEGGKPVQVVTGPRSNRAYDKTAQQSGECRNILL